MDKQTLLLGLGFVGGIILTNIAIGIAKQKFHQHKQNQLNPSSSLNNQNQINRMNQRGNSVNQQNTNHPK